MHFALFSSITVKYLGEKECTQPSILLGIIGKKLAQDGTLLVIVSKNAPFDLQLCVFNCIN